MGWTAPTLSLRLRLAIAGALSLAVVLVIAFFGLSLLFERHVERRVADELAVHLDWMISALSIRDGQLALSREPLDPRFLEPRSGLYWQVESGEQKLRSRSLWDEELALPPVQPGSPLSRTIDGPSGNTLFVVEREIIGGSRLANRTILLGVAVIRTDIDRATSAFRRDMLPYLALLGALFVAATVLQIYIGLRPLSAVRSKVADIRRGAALKIGDDFPAEILPLIHEVDELVASRELQLKRARDYAADFAHGFKTPLQALEGDIGRLRALGEAALADDIQTLTISMRRQVERQMARARMAGRSSGSTLILGAIKRLVAVLERTPNGALLHWEVDGPEDLRGRIDSEDFTEALGNILDNAARYARDTIRIALGSAYGEITITVTDDGPGIAVDKIPQVLGRGGRLDESSDGAGLGLALAQDMVTAVGGSLRLENASIGLQVTIKLLAE